MLLRNINEIIEHIKSQHQKTAPFPGHYYKDRTQYAKQGIKNQMEINKSKYILVANNLHFSQFMNP